MILPTDDNVFPGSFEKVQFLSYLVLQHKGSGLFMLETLLEKQEKVIYHSDN